MRSILLSSVRPFYAAAGDPPAGGEDPPAEPVADASGEPAPIVENTGADDGTPANAGEGTAPPSDPPAAAAPPAETWKDKELRRKHAQLQESKRREIELANENETLRTIAARAQQNGGGEEPAPAPAPTQTTYPSDNAAVEARAQQLLAQQTFDTSANAADSNGRKTYKEGWDKATETLKTLGGFDEKTMVAILATDDPAQVLFTLGSKPDEYHRIMELPEARRQNELVKLGIKVTKTAPGPSNAPAPVEGHNIRARAAATELRDDLPDEQWYARRAIEKKARWEAKKNGTLRA